MGSSRLDRKRGHHGPGVSRSATTRHPRRSPRKAFRAGGTANGADRPFARARRPPGHRARATRTACDGEWRRIRAGKAGVTVRDRGRQRVEAIRRRPRSGSAEASTFGRGSHRRPGLERRTNSTAMHLPPAAIGQLSERSHHAPARPAHLSQLRGASDDVRRGVRPVRGSARPSTRRATLDPRPAPAGQAAQHASPGATARHFRDDQPVRGRGEGAGPAPIER